MTLIQYHCMTGEKEKRIALKLLIAISVVTTVEREHCHPEGPKLVKRTVIAKPIMTVHGYQVVTVSGRTRLGNAEQVFKFNVLR